MTPKFSIITPTWNRVEGGKLRRCLASVMTQTYHDFEHIIVDDGSRDIEATRAVISDFEDYVPINYIETPHQGRVIARNTGMRAAKGEWICHLDSDDCYDPMYLETFNYYIERNPEVDWWICGAVVHGMHKDKVEGKKGLVHMVPKYTGLRKAWMPKINPAATDDNDEQKTLHFNSGHFGTGCFVFRRSCLDKTGFLPPWINHVQVAVGADEYLGYTTGYDLHHPTGNPHGEDFVLARALSIYFVPGLIDACLYLQYKR